ncbi:DUF3306 domain-containing protein [Ottowia sp. GY511]|uniref:DUF3306 domain-containing protein n=1 Tax=Ottowia flava TaxID=2675430 RepID=A0ABW4KN12_9BURK|nr:DUF3306 domain-containing protein [Ottowia sp. GY511]TXK26333.1 DUF3306 domain-containing protein [Ottowia sp. GY511]
MADEGFLGRWSRRKQGAREGQVLQEPARAEPATAAPAVPAVGQRPDDGAVAALTPAAPAADAPPAEAPPELTRQDVAKLTRESDYSAFVARSVSPEVRNAAMRKLFSDPHFNVMDGLDIYIDDYSNPTPMPASMLGQLASARFMNLVDAPEGEVDTGQLRGGDGAEKLQKEELPAQMGVGLEANSVENSQAAATTPLTGRERTGEAAVEAPGVAPSVLCNDLPTLPEAAAPQAPAGGAHADADLRLQQHDAAGRPAHRPGTE